MQRNDAGPIFFALAKFVECGHMRVLAKWSFILGLHAAFAETRISEIREMLPQIYVTFVIRDDQHPQNKRGEKTKQRGDGLWGKISLCVHLREGVGREP